MNRTDPHTPKRISLEMWILIITGVLVTGLLMMGYFLSLPNNSETKENSSSSTVEKLSKQNISTTKPFGYSQQPRWAHLPLTYRMDFDKYMTRDFHDQENLNVKDAKTRVTVAINLLQNEIPSIRLEETNTSYPDILFTWDWKSIRRNSEDTGIKTTNKSGTRGIIEDNQFYPGNTAIRAITEVSLQNNTITNASIYLRPFEKICSSFSTELDQLLNTFSINNYQNHQVTLYDIECNESRYEKQKIDDRTIAALKEIYDSQQ